VPPPGGGPSEFGPDVPGPGGKADCGFRGYTKPVTAAALDQLQGGRPAEGLGDVPDELGGRSSNCLSCGSTMEHLILNIYQAEVDAIIATDIILLVSAFWILMLIIQ
jgi:hypothetical protein